MHQANGDQPEAVQGGDVPPEPKAKGVTLAIKDIVYEVDAPVDPKGVSQVAAVAARWRVYAHAQLS